MLDWLYGQALAMEEAERVKDEEDNGVSEEDNDVSEAGDAKWKPYLNKSPPS